ncbi:MAG TPA: LysR family transcriptional regulator [Elusimicrobiota bacterium]|jgi:LysR family transcriptional activator of nhaA|nr:LysR family transcriptional regulator [Elusimicrobiota bacterium]
MIPLNYHHLYYFWTAARLGGISAAARRLYLAQPTLSAQIGTLEKRCGKRLLTRDRGRVELTPEGRIVFDYCERIFTPGQELASSIEKGLDEPTTSLRLGIQPTISRAVVLQCLDAIRRLDRAVRVKVFGASLADLEDRMRRNLLDAVLSNVDLGVLLRGGAFRSKLIGRIPLGFVATPEVAARVKRFPKDLARVPLLLRGSDNPTRKEVDRYLDRHAVAANVEAEIEDAGLLRTLAVEGQGAAALDSLAVQADLKAGNLVPLHRGSIGLEEQIWLTISRRLDSGTAPGRPGPMSAVLERFALKAVAFGPMLKSPRK